MAKSSFLPNAPTKTLWIIALVIGALGILAHYVHIDTLSTYNYEMLLIGFVVLLVGTTYKNM